MIKNILFALLLFTQLFFSQEKSYYHQALESLETGDTTSAIDLLLLSLRREKVDSSNYLLAKIYFNSESSDRLNKGRIYLNDAIQINPTNIDYRLLMADMHKKAYKNNLFDRDALTRAEHEYYKILGIDNDFEEAHFELAKLFERRYYEFANSEIANLDLELHLDPDEMYQDDIVKTRWNEFVKDVYKSGSFASIKLDDKAEEYFNTAIDHFRNTVRINNKNLEAFYKSAMLFNYSKKYNEAIKIAETGEQNLPDAYELKLAMAYAHHKLSNFKKSQENFDKAFEKMSDLDKTEYKIQSVFEIVQPSFKERIESKSLGEIEKILDYFWRIKDPLNLTPQNERLLEHYCRMLYANYYLSPYDPYVHDLGDVEIKGWKSERGNIYVRYGEPELKKRLRANGINYKTDIWDYGDFEFNFVDATNRKNFKLGDSFAGGMFTSQYGGESKKLSDDLMLSMPNDYKPNYQGPLFDMPFNLYQMKGKYATDVYLNFSIENEQLITSNSVYEDGINYGVFFFDNFMNPIVELRDSLHVFDNSNFVKINDENSFFVKSLHSVFPSKDGNFAFEVERKNDNGIATNRSKLKVRRFPKLDVLLSDIVLASDVKLLDAAGTTITRGNYNILPNPLSTFSSDTQLFLYFEIYNLQKDSSNLTNFEQQIAIQEKQEDGLSGILNSFTDFIGIDSKGDKITLASNYSTLESDPQIYLQLDLGEYDEGEYQITVTIKDNVADKQISGTADLIWQK